MTYRTIPYAVLTVSALGIAGDLGGLTFAGASWEWVLKLDLSHHDRVIVRATHTAR